MDSDRGRDLATFFGDQRRSEKFSEIKPPLKNPNMRKSQLNVSILFGERYL